MSGQSPIRGSWTGRPPVMMRLTDTHGDGHPRTVGQAQVGGAQVLDSVCVDEADALIQRLSNDQLAQSPPRIGQRLAVGCIL
jgi:hypothetical protein